MSKIHIIYFVDGLENALRWTKERWILMVVALLVAMPMLAQWQEVTRQPDVPEAPALIVEVEPVPTPVALIKFY